MKYDEGKITLKNILDDVMNEVYMTLIFFFFLMWISHDFFRLKKESKAQKKRQY